MSFDFPFDDHFISNFNSEVNHQLQIFQNKGDQKLLEDILMQVLINSIGLS